MGRAGCGPNLKDIDPWRAGTDQINPQEIVAGGLVSQATGTPHHRTAGTTQAEAISTKQLGAGTVCQCWAGTGLSHGFSIHGLDASHQFDNVILPQPCGFSPTALNRSPPPRRPTDTSHLLLPLTHLWAFTLQTLLGSSLHLFGSHKRIQDL